MDMTNVNTLAYARSLVYTNFIYILVFKSTRFARKRLPCKCKLISNQIKKVVIVNIIFIAFFNKLQLAYYTTFSILSFYLFLFVYAFALFYMVFFLYMSFFYISLFTFLYSFFSI